MSDPRTLKNEFLQKWPLTKIEQMTLEEFTNNNKNSFCWWVEFYTHSLGDIRGGSSYKFGIYRRQTNLKEETRSGYLRNAEYGWLAKYGKTPEAAFLAIKAQLVNLVRAALKKDWEAVNRISLAEAFKWKIAFLYSEGEILSIYKATIIRNIAETLGEANVRKRSIPDLQHAIMTRRKPEEDYFQFSWRMWEVFAEKESPNDAGSDSMKTEAIFSGPLNLILYGPPGTGKTYSTISRSVEIADFGGYSEISDDRDAIRSRFQELLITDFENATGRIAFTTFHQAFGYEDFVEGIKPISPKEGDTFLKYEVKDGIFKRMADLASAYRNFKENTIKASVIIPDSEWANARFFKVSPTVSDVADGVSVYEFWIKHGCITYGGSSGMNFEGKTEKEILDYVEENKNDSFGAGIRNFVALLRPGDYVIASINPQRAAAIGRVKGGYIYKAESQIGQHHVRDIEWLVYNEDIPTEEFYSKAFFNSPIYKLNNENLKRDFFQGVSRHMDQKVVQDRRENFVLIIDEINRGNVAQIFGELITLIEKDKRQGGKEQLEVVLPYSKQSFTVPDNLYIIGTMNTADRSVEALDTALRRRFKFEELSPNPRLLHPGSLIINLWLRYSQFSWSSPEWEKSSKPLYDFLGAGASFKGKQEQLFEDLVGGHYVGEEALQYLETKVGDADFTGIRMDRILEKLNRRIEILLDKDHCIGHSYFMHIENLKGLQDAFQYEIIPLLQEYFYGDFGKIGLVMGKDFIEYKIASTTELASFEYDDVDSLQARPIYRMVNVAEMEEGPFRAALAKFLA